MAGTVRVTANKTAGPGAGAAPVEMIELLATADAADGSFPTLDLGAYSVWGTLLALQTNPGSTAPTDNYDITLVDADGVDRLDSVGLDRDTSSSERVAITGAPWVAPGETLTLTIANNAVNSATIVIKLWYVRTTNTAPGFHQALNGTIDSVSISAATSGGVDVFRSLDLDESEEEVKATAGQVHWIYTMNLRTSNLYLKLYDATAANTTVGTTTPKATIPLASNATDDVAHMLTFVPPIAFATAISAAATTGLADADTGAPGANECVVLIGYK